MKHLKFILFLGSILAALAFVSGCCLNDNDGDGIYTDGGICGKIDCDDTDPAIGACECFWTISIEGGGNFNGNGAVHQFPSVVLPSFSLTLNHFDEPNEGLGAVQTLDGPGPNEIGSFAVLFNFQFEDRVWTATDGSEDTSATMVVTKNTGEALEGMVDGIAETVEGTKTAFRSFSLRFRSNHGGQGKPVCGDK
jgi:hypothetical protein